jgi:hypothetical protein
VGKNKKMNRMWYKNGKKLCKSGMSMMGIKLFKVNYRKVFMWFYLCKSIKNFGKRLWNM